MTRVKDDQVGAATTPPKQLSCNRSSRDVTARPMINNYCCRQLTTRYALRAADASFFRIFLTIYLRLYSPYPSPGVASSSCYEVLAEKRFLCPCVKWLHVATL